MPIAMLLAHVALGNALIIAPAAASLRAPAVHRLRGGSPEAVTISSDAVAIVVDVEVTPEAVEEFLKVMKADCEGSRNEPGCLRFDVLRASETRFFFYEAYTSADAVDEHKAQPHFKLWSDFKAKGGVVSSVSTKCTVAGDWGFQGKGAGRNVAF